MRAHVLSMLGLVLAGCGGNWSNSDVAFSNALPRREDLKSRLPANSTSQPLTSEGTRRDELVVGDPSGAWAQTRKAATDYNGLLDALLGLVDQVRAAPPTSRTSDSRTWGPYDDANNPGRQVQVVITRGSEDVFEWKLELRQAGGTFIEALTGQFQATDTARRGRGNIVVHAKDFRELVSVNDSIAQLDELTIGYLTDVFPKRVEMLFTFKPGSTTGFSTFGYTAREQQDGSGAMRFVYDTPGPDVEQLEINAAWKPTGEGRSVGKVLKGRYQGATVTECWGRSFTVVLYAEDWLGGMTSGSPEQCTTFDDF